MQQLAPGEVGGYEPLWLPVPGTHTFTWHFNVHDQLLVLRIEFRVLKMKRRGWRRKSAPTVQIEFLRSYVWEGGKR